MPSSRKSPLIPLVIVLVAVVALVALALQGDGEETTSSGAAPSSQGSGSDDTGEALARRQVDDPTALGDVDAPVVLIAYSEFQCPFCGKFARDTEPELIDEYVEDGTLRIEWRDFPYLGPESMTAA